MPIPPDNLSYPVLVRMPISQGTGFFLNTPTAIYLVTAKHVLFKDGKVISNEIELEALPRDLKERKKMHLVVNLKALYDAKKVYVPAGEDVVSFKVFSLATASKPGEASWKAAIEPNIRVQESPTSGFVGADKNTIRFFEEVVVGNDTILFGYPSSISIRSNPQIDYSSPLLKKGIVAGKNESKKTVIVDCSVFPGNSGGPVIQINQRDPYNIDFFVIGVVSEYVPYYSKVDLEIDGKPKTLESFANSGYAVVVPMDKVFEMLGIKKE